MNPLLFNLGAPEIIIITLLVILLFGGKKIPELMKGLGKGIKNFKDGTKGIDNEPDNKKKDSQNNEDPKE